MSQRSTLNRRELLQRTAGAAAVVAFPTIIPSRAFGANERIRIGFIGVKNRGMQNLKPLMKHAVAVCDVDRTVMAAAQQAVEKANGSCATYSDYRKMLESKDIDAVVISTPDHWHARQMVDACAAGKDVYCEKPLTLTIDEGKEMVKAARKYGRIAQTGSQQRSDDKFRLACELVRSGRLERIHTVRVGISKNNFAQKVVPDSAPPAELDYDMWLGPAPQRPYNVNRVHYNFRFFWDYSGGQMTNWGAHHLDIAQWGLGMDESGPVSIEGRGEYGKENYYEVPDLYDVKYTYANGVTVLCSQQNRQGTQFEGNSGTIFVTRGKIEASDPEIISRALGDSDVHLYESKDHYQNWLECIKSRKTPICDVAIGHRSATVCHLGNIAVRTGRKVTWDPAKEMIVGDAEQEKMQRYSYRKPWVFPV
jgi:predicted dehydrogenase